MCFSFEAGKLHHLFRMDWKADAVLFVDVLNPMAFPNGRALAEHARACVPHLLRVRREAHARRIPVVSTKVTPVG